jgi:thiamine kinase-like enzyme
MLPDYKQKVLAATSAKEIKNYETLQSLWSGYGEIVRVELEGGDVPSVVAKIINYPKPENHPRGWQSDFAHQRKLTSYQVESNWYANYANKCPDACYTPEYLWSETSKQNAIILIEDLTVKYPEKLEQIEFEQVKVCLTWLATFHAHNFQDLGEKLWPVGTYWHLDTRPEELAAMSDESLKSVASAIDQKLKDAHFQTLVHGDAKLDNFCFSSDGKSAAAVDFQYTGPGVGVKDVVYFFSSCLSSDECFELESELLIHYFDVLKRALADKLNERDKFLLEQEWRSLYSIAWADFQRFLNGWSPGHWKLNDYSQKQTLMAISTVTDRRRS